MARGVVVRGQAVAVRTVPGPSVKQQRSRLAPHAGAVHRCVVLVGVPTQQLVLLALHVHRLSVVFTGSPRIFEGLARICQSLAALGIYRTGLVPTAMGSQVCGTAENFVALGAPVLNAHDARALVLREGKWVRVLFLAELADELPQRMVPRGNTLLPLPPQLGALLLNSQTQNRRGRDFVLKVKFSVDFGFLGRVLRGLFAVHAAAQSLVLLKKGTFPRCVMFLLVQRRQWWKHVHVSRLVLLLLVPVGRLVVAAARQESLDGRRKRVWS